jgi:hypothetical protein
LEASASFSTSEARRFWSIVVVLAGHTRVSRPSGDFRRPKLTFLLLQRRVMHFCCVPPISVMDRTCCSLSFPTRSRLENIRTAPKKLFTIPAIPRAPFHHSGDCSRNLQKSSCIPQARRCVYWRRSALLFVKVQLPPQIIGSLPTSSAGMRIYASIAAENAAKPAHPSAAACGPPPLARKPPVKHPAATPFPRSFFAR